MTTSPMESPAVENTLLERVQTQAWRGAAIVGAGIALAGCQTEPVDPSAAPIQDKGSVFIDADGNRLCNPALNMDHNGARLRNCTLVESLDGFRLVDDITPFTTTAVPEEQEQGLALEEVRKNKTPIDLWKEAKARADNKPSSQVFDSTNNDNEALETVTAIRDGIVNQEFTVFGLDGSPLLKAIIDCPVMFTDTVDGQGILYVNRSNVERGLAPSYSAGMSAEEFDHIVDQVNRALVTGKDGLIEEIGRETVYNEAPVIGEFCLAELANSGEIGFDSP